MYDSVVKAGVRWKEHPDASEVMNAVGGDGILCENVISVEVLGYVIQNFNHCGCLGDPYKHYKEKIYVDGVMKIVQIFDYDTESG